MDAIDYLFYGFGQVVYSLALSDGDVQRAEEAELQAAIKQGLAEHGINYSVSEIIFKLLRSEKTFNAGECYSQGLKNIALGRHKLTDDIRSFMIGTLQRIAKSYPPIVIEESGILDKFEEDLAAL